MTLLVEKGTFTKETSAVNGTDQTITLTNSSLTPKVVWLWSHGDTANGTYAEHYFLTYGYSDGTSTFCMCETSEDNQGNSDAQGYYATNRTIFFGNIASPGNIDAQGTLLSFGAGQFTIDWNTSSSAATIIHYMVIGGDDITNVKVLNTTVAVTATGNRAYTGIGFQGDFIQLLSPGVATSQSVAQTPSIGVATSSSARWAFGGASEDAQAVMDTYNYKMITRCVTNWTVGTGALLQDADFVSFGADGWTLNWTDAPNSATNVLSALVIKGGLWNVGNGTAPASTGDQTITTTSGRDPEGVQMFTWGDTTTSSAGTGEAENRMCIGGGDNSLSMGCISMHDTDNADPSVTSRISLTNKIMRAHTAAATATSSTTLAEASLTNMSNDGNFVINWSTTLSGMGYVWFSVSQTAFAGTQFNRSPTAEDVTVSDASLTRVLSATRVPSTDSTTVSDSSLTRMLSATRVPSSDSTTVTEASLTRSKTWPRVPSSDSTTVTDSSLTRVLSAVRVPSTEVVTPSESSLTRMLSASRTPSSDSVTAQDSSTTRMISRARAPSTDATVVSDISVTRLLSLTRAPSSDSITASDSSLTRIYSALRVPSQDSITTSENVTGEKTVAGVQFDRAPSAENVTVSESSLTRLLSAIRVPTTEVVSIVDASLTRLLQLFRSPSSDSITVVENSLTRIKSALRIPTADSVTVADSSLTRLLSSLRLPSTDAVTTGEMLTRILSAIRSPSTDSITTSENVSSLHTTAGQFNRSPVAETVTVGENLSRLLQLTRVPTTDTVNLNEQLARIISRNRVPSSDSISISDSALTRVVSNIRSLSETPAVVEASLTRMLSAVRSLNDTTVVSELQSQLSLSRRLEETVSVTEPVIQRIVTAIRTVTPDIVEVDEQVFFQALHKFVFDSVAVAESLFSIRQALSGSVTYATPAEVRPLLGNIGAQRTDTQIQTAIDSAYDEINRKTGRQPPNDWKDTENDFGIVKKICRFKAALEMAVGIKDFEDREWMQKEIEEMFKIIEEGEGESATTSTDIVGSSPDATYALNPQGVIWSVRYQNLRKGGSGENDTTINPDT